MEISSEEFKVIINAVRENNIAEMLDLYIKTKEKAEESISTDRFWYHQYTQLAEKVKAGEKKEADDE